MAAASAVLKIERAHQMYRDGQHSGALVFYTEALAMAKTKPQKIALHSNRAACYLKLHDFKKAAEECTSVLELDHQHTGALMLRAQTLVTLKEYHSALFDVNRLMELNPSSDVYKNLQARLRTQLSLAPIPESEEESLGLEEDEDTEEEGQKQEIASEDDLEKKKETPGGESLPVVAQKENIKNDLNMKFDSSKGESGDAFVPMQNGNDGFGKKNEFPGAKSEAKLVQPRLVDENVEVSKARGLVEQPQNVQKKDMTFSKAFRQVENVQEKDKELNKARESAGNVQIVKKSAEAQTKAWEAIPKPKGHLRLDYSRWDQVSDDSSEEEEDEEDQQPQYRFRVRTVGVRP